MKSIICVGYQIPGFSSHFHGFQSKVSLSDGDIVVFCPDIQYPYNYNIDGDFEGRPRYSEDASFRVKEDTEHWKRELLHALDAGKTVFVFLIAKQEIAVFSRREYSGTGRSQRQMNYFDFYDNYQWVPFGGFRIDSVNGKKIQKPTRHLFVPYYDAFKEDLSYEAVMHVDDVNPVFRTPSGERMLGCHVKCRKGNLILLPYLYYDRDAFTERNKKDESIWSKKAITWGNKLVSSLIEIDDCLSSTSAGTPAPQWTSGKKFLLDKEITIAKDIDSTEGKISRLNKKMDDLRACLQEEKMIKGLLFESGKPLENAVIKALKILGYQAEGYDDGTLQLDQVIIAPDGWRFVGECEGKDNKAVNIDKFRQLSDAIDEDFAREAVAEEATGILFGNAYRLEPLSKRKQFFTQKCLAGAKRRNYALIRTPDLFLAAKYVLESDDQEYKQKCQESITKGLGGIIKFPAVPKKK